MKHQKTMALNWGHKITIVLILFAALMFTLVFKSIQTDYQLVSKDYYKDELQYQQVIDGSNNASALSSMLLITQNEAGIQFQFPREMLGKEVTGTYWFYCAYADKNDRRLPIQTTADGTQLISRGLLTGATYTVKTSWKTGSSFYYNEQSFTVQ